MLVRAWGSDAPPSPVVPVIGPGRPSPPGPVVPVIWLGRPSSPLGPVVPVKGSV